MKSGIIYKATNVITGKSYIGKTIKTLEYRKREHFYDKGNTYFHNSLRKYGEKNFIWTIIEKCNNECDLSLAEQWYIRCLKTFKPNGYNLTYGGEGMSGYKHTEETKKKLSNMFSGEKHPMYGKQGNNKGNKQTKESNEKRSKTLKNVKKTKTHIKNISEAKKGNKNPMSGKFGKDNPSSSKYKIIFPNNDEKIIIGIAKFCRDYFIETGIKLNEKCLSAVARKKQKQHKGFKCEYI